MKPVFAAVVLAPLASARADVFARFDIWVEAPAVVEAGDIIEFEVWGKVSGPVLGEGLGAVLGFRADVQILAPAGLVNTIEAASFPLPLDIRNPGHTGADGIDDVINGQLSEFGQMFLDNPMPLFSSRVHTSASHSGLLTVLPMEWAAERGIMGWYIDVSGYSFPGGVPPKFGLKCHRSRLRLRCLWPARRCRHRIPAGSAAADIAARGREGQTRH